MSPRGIFWPALGKALQLRNAMPCVGLVVLGGCLTFIVAPDEQPFFDRPPEPRTAFPIVVLDAGHGGRDDGAGGNGRGEKERTLAVAGRPARLLKQFGFETVMTRTADVFVPLPDRTALANRLEDAVFISIHFNHASRGTGIETFFASEKVQPENSWTWIGFFNQPPAVSLDNGETLAGFIQTSLVLRTEATNRGIHGRPLYVVRHTRCPAALVECGFLSDPFEARLIANADYRERISQAIAEGVMSYTKSRPRPASSAPDLAEAGAQ